VATPDRAIEAVGEIGWACHHVSRRGRPAWAARRASRGSIGRTLRLPPCRGGLHPLLAAGSLALTAAHCVLAGQYLAGLGWVSGQ
jgi:hypothetical protein